METSRRVSFWMAAVATLAAAAGGARAVEDSAPWLVWSCRLDSGETYSVQCDLPAAGEPVSSPAPVAPIDHDRYSRALFAPGMAPYVARLVRADAATYGRQRWTIPLFASPIETNDVRRLALAVLCGRDPRCVIRFDGVVTVADCGEWARQAPAPGPETQAAVAPLAREHVLPCQDVAVAGRRPQR